MGPYRSTNCRHDREKFVAYVEAGEDDPFKSPFSPDWKGSQWNDDIELAGDPLVKGFGVKDVLYDSESRDGEGFKKVYSLEDGGYLGVTRGTDYLFQEHMYGENRHGHKRRNVPIFWHFDDNQRLINRPFTSAQRFEDGVIAFDINSNVPDSDRVYGGTKGETDLVKNFEDEGILTRKPDGFIYATNLEPNLN
jgi:hypothetical protein